MNKRVRESGNMFIVVIDVKTSTEKVISVLQNDTVDILLKRCVEAFSLPFGSFNVTYAGLSLDSSAPVGTQLAEGATLTLTRRKFHLSDVPPEVKPEELLNLCATHDNLLPQIMSQDPELGEKLATKDIVKVRTLIMQRALRQHKSIFARDQELKKIWDNPDDEQNQKKIAEMIRLEQIEAARLMAMEQNPESFASVYMLYVPLEVNGVPLKAFVDSGAQMTIMSPQCAERCGILRLMDDRYKGIASGVGTAKILGKIHMVQMKLGRSFFPVSVTILENASMDVLFGLDTLKRYRCCIDLNRGMLGKSEYRRFSELGFT